MSSYKQRGIELDPYAPSPFHLPETIVQAQDPPEEEVPEAADEEKKDEPFSMEELEDLTGLGADEGSDKKSEEDKPEEDTEEDKPEAPTEEEMVKEKEESPAATWTKYLQPILRDIEINLHVPIKLKNSFTVGYDDDADLGFHILGTVDFLEGVPEDLEETLQGRPLKYKAYVSPDGLLSDHVELVYPSTESPYQPVFRRNPNVFSG